MLQIGQIIDLNKPYYRAVQIRCVALHQDGKWINGICTIKATPDEDLKKNENRHYDEFLFLEQYISCEQLLTLLAQVASGELEIAGKQIYIGENINFREKNFLHRNNDYSSLPGYYYPTNSINNYDIPSQSLLSFELPFYPDIHTAIREWIDLRRLHNGDGRLKSILLFLPECRAYFDELIYNPEDELLHAQVARQDAALKLQIKGGYRLEDSHEKIEKNLNNGGPITIKISPEDAERIEDFNLFLIDDNNNILDYHQENRFRVFGKHSVFTGYHESAIKSVIKDAVSMGECLTIEFKPYIKKGDHKINEVIETVIAFANTKGGYIFIGINDHTVPEGIDKEIQKEARKRDVDFRKVTEEYIGYLRKTITDKLNKPLRIQIEPVAFNQLVILVLKIPEGEQKPYANIATKDIFIRKSGNNAKPDPDTDLLDLLKTDPLTRYGWNR